VIDGASEELLWKNKGSRWSVFAEIEKLMESVAMQLA
jgi:hypothetical protein